ncbi:MAG: cytochrome c [Betaproteobacteria bacterium]|nr:cytochrome c [Betaproteobacteria bacterium]
MAVMATPLSCSLAADAMAGKEVYEEHCERCHGEDGRGSVAGAPDFSRGTGLMAPDAEIARMLRTGRGAMPAYEGLLRQQQLLDVIAYMRGLQR